METLLGDVRYGIRQLLKHPAFTILAIISLALGIGANTAIFSLVNTVLLRPLPVKEPSQLIEVYGALHNGADFTLQSYLNYKDYRDRNDVFSGLFVYRIVVSSLSHDGNNQRAWAFSSPETISMFSASNRSSAADFFPRKIRPPDRILLRS